MDISELDIELEPGEEGWTLTVGPPSKRASPISKPERRLQHAIKWLSDLDNRYATRLGRAEPVVIQIPAARAAEHRAAPIESEDAARTSRPRALELIRPLLMPRRCEDPLYPYQRDGVAWLLRTRRGILADDMGLGKTLQCVAALRRLIRIGRVRWVVIVCPKSLVATWEHELSRWAPELRFRRVTPAASSAEGVWKEMRGRAHALITTYDHLRSHYATLAESTVPLLIADEAHRIRNFDAKTSTAIRKLQYQRLWCLTGTPIERDEIDLLTLLTLIAPTRFSDADASLDPSVIRARARPFVLRRRKDEVLTQLPPIASRREQIELTKTQALSYKATLKTARNELDNNGFLARLNQLRTICDFDPKTGASSKADRIVELCEDIGKLGEKTIVFSYLIEPLRILQTRFAETNYAEQTFLLTGDLDTEQRSRVIDGFKAAPGAAVLLASLRVASEGLTLTEANHVIFFNEWWNPSSNAQARDRVRRIGQTRNVFSYTFTCRDTVEEALVRILDSKEQTFEMIVDGLARPSTVRSFREQLLEVAPKV